MNLQRADLTGSDATAVGALVHDYLTQTEKEKVEHGLAEASNALPKAYRDEVADPGSAYAGHAVFIAVLDDSPVGVVVLRGDADDFEIKRLWASPAARGRGVGSALLDAAIRESGGRVRLSVWEWRADAIRLYESRGFVRAPSWDERAGLVCMRRTPG